MRHVLLVGGPADGVRHDGEEDLQMGDKIKIYYANPICQTFDAYSPLDSALYEVQSIREPCGEAVWIGAKK